MNDLQVLTGILEDLNQADSFTQVAERLTSWARAFTGCQAAILRLLEKEDDGTWVAGCLMDGHTDLFARDEAMVHGAECICGRVALGLVDPLLPFYTDGGSFCWGRMSALTYEFSPDQLGPLRGRCVTELYESIAIFPVRAGEQQVGVLHLADSRPNWFTESSPVVEAACRLAGDNLLRHKVRERERALLETIETALLPANPPAVAGLEVGVSFTSATEMARVGGDFYDVLDLGDAGALVLVGDVSGKGVGAVGTATRARCAIEAQANLTSDPASFMSASNDSLARMLPRARYVAAVACLIDRRSGLITACLAGHPLPLLLTPTGATEIEAPSNPPLGLFSGLRYSQATCQLSPEDTLLIYTDGVTDSRRGNGIFGQEGVARAAEGLPRHDPSSIARSVCSAAARFHDASLPGDDRLVVAVRLRENGGDSASATG